MNFGIIFRMSKLLATSLKKKALELGFTMVGIVEARPGNRLVAYERWLVNEYHGQMAYMARPDRRERRRDPNLILSDVKSIICLGLDYQTVGPPEQFLNDPSRGRISNYAWGIDYHYLMTPKLEELANWLGRQSAAGVKSKVYVDTGAILERDHAESAGLGFTGKNTMLIGPRSGSFFFLGEILTTAELTPDPIAVNVPSCGTCYRCLDACPTDAFPRPYVLDARRCISYLTIELKGVIPQDLRPLIGNWVYGCDVCQAVCPFNRFAEPFDKPEFAPSSWEAAAPRLIDLLTLGEADFEKRFHGSPIKRIKRSRLLRNACVAAGNWGSDEALPALIRLLEDPDPLIRGHAAWAVGKVGGAKANIVLKRALSTESEDWVRVEINTYIG